MTIISFPDKVAVIFDAENVRKGATGVLPFGLSYEDVRIDFGRLADAIAAKRNRPSVVTAIEVHTSIPDRFRQPRAFAYATAQQRDWARDPRVTVFARPLAYRPDGTARQKGVDSATARGMRTHRVSGAVDAVVLATADRDLEPDIEEALTTAGARIESACWITQKALFVAAGGRTLWNHDLDELDLRRCSVAGRAA